MGRKSYDFKTKLKSEGERERETKKIALMNFQNAMGWNILFESASAVHTHNVHESVCYEMDNRMMIYVCSRTASLTVNHTDKKKTSYEYLKRKENL